MKYIYLLPITLLAFILSACKSDQLTLLEAQAKAESFLTGRTNDKGFNYTAGGEDPSVYYPRYFEETNAIRFKYDDQDWQDGVTAMDDFMGRILGEEANSPGAVTRMDLQFLTFLNFDEFIFPAPPSLEKAQRSAQNLERLMRYTQPIEWKILTDALILASPALSAESFRTFSDYIQEGAALTLQDPDKIVFDQRELASLQEDARFALKTLRKQ